MSMVIRKGYNFRLNTSPVGEALMRQFAGCNRFLWNKALALQKESVGSWESSAFMTERRSKWGHRH